MCICVGVDNPGTQETGNGIVGCVAGDEDCYTTFAELFDALIDWIHGHYPRTARQDVDLSVGDMAEDSTEDDSLDPAYILGYELQAKRNISGYNLSPLCSRYGVYIALSVRAVNACKFVTAWHPCSRVCLGTLMWCIYLHVHCC